MAIPSILRLTKTELFYFLRGLFFGDHKGSAGEKKNINTTQCWCPFPFLLFIKLSQEWHRITLSLPSIVYNTGTYDWDLEKTVIFHNAWTVANYPWNPDTSTIEQIHYKQHEYLVNSANFRRKTSKDYL